MRVAVQKLEGVESVDVSLERALATIRLGPSNRVTLPRLRQIIKDNGFSAKEATVTVIGALVERGGKPALSVTGTETVWLLAPAATHTAAYEEAVRRLKTQESSPIEAEGIVAPPANTTDPETLNLTRLNGASK